MKILYVLPHCSTGGMPQYVLKLIEETIKQYYVEVVEIDNHSDEYTVQRDKIKQLVPFHQLHGDKTKLIDFINRFDIIHFQEIPETFIPINILNKFYRKGRSHRVYVTTHSSYTNPSSLQYTADKFVLVSEWSRKQFEREYPGICDIWEYPIEYINYNKEEAKQKFGWHVSYKHVLHVGLFTPGKNQGEIIEIAKQCIDQKILFHFVGNQAINFKQYWEPLMRSLPSNCVIHGEVSNPEDYYKAADLFYFPSLFELNPLAVKEALSYRLPVMLRKLHIYENTYDGKVRYISDNLKKNIEHLFDLLNIKNRRLGVYDIVKLNQESIIDRTISINFVNGAYVQINNAPRNKFFVEFINTDTGKVEHSGEIENNCWIKATKSYYINWLIKINGEEYVMDLSGKRVYISIESSALGDTLAWIPYVEEFRKKHQCEIICSTFKNELFINKYPDIQFIEPGDSVLNIIAQYRIGWFYNNEGKVDLYKNPSDFKSIPLQKTASDILGLDYQEIKPNINFPRRNIKKQVAIAIHGTTQAKYWNNPTGWQEVVDYLKSAGYEVILLSKEEDGYMGNQHPKGVLELLEKSLENAIQILRESEFFIGIGSGLSWLAWACEVPVYLISGFSEPFTETISGTIRIDAPEGACRGCFNDYRLDAGDWNWCPKYKGTDRQFECSRLITSEMIINKLPV